MIICNDMLHAVSMHDANAETPFYAGYENVAEEHRRFFAAYPDMGSQWLYCPEDNAVYNVSKFKGQRIVNKHTIVDSISNGVLRGVVANIEDDTVTLSTAVNGIGKTDVATRKEWCKRSTCNFLMGNH